MPSLLAKSTPMETLREHTENCLAVYDSLRDRMPFLAEVAKELDFFEHLFYSVALHDFGKAATGFQCRLTTGTQWNYRHEILSAGFVAGLQLPWKTKQAIGLTILTHHKDISTLRDRYRHYPESTDGFQVWRDRITELEPNWEALMVIQEQVSRWCSTEDCIWIPVTSTEQLLNGYRDFLLPYRNAIRKGKLTPLHGTYGILLRGCMIACDHLASAGKTKSTPLLETWKTGYFNSLKKGQKRKTSTSAAGNPFKKQLEKSQGNLCSQHPPDPERRKLHFSGQLTIKCKLWAIGSFTFYPILPVLMQCINV